jgi:PPE-repeat protein
MNFSVSPPEVTSAQMYSGAGSGPMLAAAASWDWLGSELSSAAELFSSVTSGVPWQGAAATAMTSVATQYAQWLTAAASHAEGTAAQAKVVAGIFEATKAAITHPAAVAANRLQLLSLVRSNLFGFNAPAIAATEGAYESMWAQNVAALSGYHGGASAAAAQLTPLQQAPQTLSSAAASVGAGRVFRQITANDRADLAGLQKYDVSQIADARAASGRDVAVAAKDLGSGRVGGAVRRVADAGLVDTRAAVRVTARTGSLPLAVAGQDVAILSGRVPPPPPPPPPTPPPPQPPPGTD